MVVIGGGAIGASTAFHLARRGIRDVVLLERGTIASGSTGKAVGGFRLQFGDEVNIRACQRSLAAFERLGPELAELGVDVDIALRQPGYLILLSTDEQVGFFREAIAVQNRLGVPTQKDVQALTKRVEELTASVHGLSGGKPAAKAAARPAAKKAPELTPT